MKPTLSALTALGVTMLGIPVAPGITKIEQNTRTVERQSVTTVTIGQGMTRMIWVTGPWMDWVNDVNASGGVDGTIKSKTMGVGTGEVQIILTATSSATPGEKIISLDVKCPILPLDCAPGPFPLKVKVFETGPISGISPNDIVAPNALTTYTLTGEGLGSAALLSRLTTLKNASIVSKSASTLVVSGTNPSCGGVDIELIASGGPEDMPYKKSAGLALPIAGGACGTNFSYHPITGGGSPGGPDLQPVIGAPVFRHLAPTRKVASEPFCHGMFAQATTAIVRTITVGDLVWGVKNTGGSAVTTSFHARLLRNGAVVADQTIASLNAGASVSFTYRRPQSQTEVARLALVPNSSTQQIYNATGGECVQTVGQDAGYDWQDPQWTIEVDAAGVIGNDINRSNNNRSF